MKLTKGKISKLYNKKKQSLKKKVNKKKSSSRNKTFRKKRNIHLARKSLKRFHYKKQRGGAEDGEGEGTPKVDEVSNSVTESMNLPTSETLDQSNIKNVDQRVDLSTTPMEANNVETTVDLSTTPLEQENVETPLDLSTTPLEQENLSTLQSDTVPNKKELMNSLSNVVDYITDAVAEKVSLNVSSAQFGEKPQNGFDSVNAAAEMMAKSGGKRKKTRKFKLTKKNKTKKAKKA